MNLIWQYCTSGKQGTWPAQSGKEKNGVGIVSWKNVQYNKSQNNHGFKTTDIGIAFWSETSLKSANKKYIGDIF